MPVEHPQYPVNLNITGKPCLVVGGGSVAAHKIDGLLAAHAIVDVIAIQINAEVRTRSIRNARERAYERGDVNDYKLVVSATNNADINRLVFKDGEAAGIWVNSADDPSNCAFTLPSVVRRGPVMVAMSTGGHSPAFATWMRKHVESEIGPEYEELVMLLSDRRTEMKQLGIGTESVDWTPVFEKEVIDLIRSGDGEAARQQIRDITTPREI